jgi:hypothetical protein
MSLAYKDSRSKPKMLHPELLPDLDAALEAISTFKSDHYVASKGNIPVARAQHLMREFGKVEPMLLAAIKDLSVKTKAEAVSFVQANTAEFPAVKFVNLIQDNLTRVEQTGVDGEGHPIYETIPATWAETITAAKVEEV